MKTKVITSFEEYINYTEKYKNQYYFRGQANCEWDIKPSIFRNEVSIASESEMIKKEMTDSKLNPISAIFKLQHYGFPTRLCDLSISPLSALYFTIEDITQNNCDGVVFVFKKDNAVDFTNQDITLFTKFLISEHLKISDITDKGFSEEEIRDILSQNYIIRYNYLFSYSNTRAILQGGTALLFGLNCEGNNIESIGKCNIDNLIEERIVIPSDIKLEIAEKLKKIGFMKEILYQTFETLDVCKDFNVHIQNSDEKNHGDFYKIVSEYKIDNLYFDRDELIKRIDLIYVSLFDKYGPNSRIWLFFYYDKNDLEAGNFFCRTEWDDMNGYIIKWGKDYYINRLRNINEQASEQEVIESFCTLVEDITPAYHDISTFIMEEDYKFKDLLDLIKENELKVKSALGKADNFLRGNCDIQKFSDAAYSYLSDMERLIDEMLFYNKRGEKEQFLRYWVQILLKDCNKSKMEFDQQMKDIIEKKI